MAATEKERIICFFNSCKAWGGGEKWHFEMAIRLINEGFRVMICARPGSSLYNHAISANVPVYPFKIGNLSFFNPFLFFKLLLFFRQKGITHLILNLSSDLKAAGPAARKAGVSDIVYRRGSAIPIRDNLFNRYLFRKVVHRVLTNSEETKRTILGKNPRLISSRKIGVIYNGIDLHEFDEQKVTTYNQGKSGIVLGNLGRLVPQKNQFFLLKVLKEIHNKGYEAKLRIGGTGDLMEKLKTEVKRQKLENSVELAGFVSDIKSFMTGIDIFVLPSLWEGFGYVLVEAHACKKPVVAFNVSSNPEIVIHNENGLLVPVNNAEAFADAVIELIKSSELREKLGHNGRLQVEKKFDISVRTRQLVEFLNLNSRTESE